VIDGPPGVESAASGAGAAARRQALVEAAFGRIAEAGFEGLRTRDVAAEVGINVATLHYHFPTKEALIRGVVAHAMRKFAATLPREGTPADQLRGHLRALRRLLRDEPPLFAVLGELALRAPRDPIIAAIVGDMDDGWHRTVESLVRRGVEQGSLDRDLDPDEVASLLVAAIKGVSLPTIGALRPERLDQTFHQLERWLGLTKEDSP
jgi:AcrR family transcriptional regulator